MLRIIAVCPTTYPGVNAVFRHGAALGLWRHENLKSTLPANDLVILGAWHPYYTEYLERYRCIVYLTSTFGQMEFSENLVELENNFKIAELLRKNKLKALLSGWPDVVDFFETDNPGKAFYCPYPFNEGFMDAVITPASKIPDSIGVFLPATPRKNTVNQLLAASKSRMKVYTNIPDTFIEATNVGWLTNEEYFRLISTLKITLHCTFTESYSYAAAESLMLGTLPIVSLQVCDNLNLTGDLVCYQCDSVTEILKKIERIKSMDILTYEFQVKKSQSQFRFKNEINLRMTKDVLDKITQLIDK